MKYKIISKIIKEWISDFIEEDFEEAKRILEKNNMQVGDFIDCGAMGKVYRAKDDTTKVIKITSDRDEAYASNIVKLKGPLENVVEVYNVYYFKTIKRADLYAIIEEYLLYDLTREEAKAVSIFRCLNSSLLAVRLDKINSFAEYMDFRKENLKGYDEEDIYPQNSIEEKVWRDVFNGIKSLDNVGVQATDYHSANVMKNSRGDYVLIDLSLAESPHSDIPIIEQVTEETFFNPFLDSIKIGATRNVLARHGIETGEEIGSGAFGVIYRMKNNPNKVVKITSDDLEAMASNIVKLKGPLENVVEIYNVYKIKPLEGVFAIIEKYLPIKLNEEEKSAVTNFGRVEPDRLWRKHSNATFEDYLKHRGGFYEVSTPTEFEKEIWEDLFNGLKQLKKHGVIHNDYHYGNVMKDNAGDYILIDFTGAKSPQSKVSVVEHC